MTARTANRNLATHSKIAWRPTKNCLATQICVSTQELRIGVIQHQPNTWLLYIARVNTRAFDYEMYGGGNTNKMSDTLNPAFASSTMC